MKKTILVLLLLMVVLTSAFSASFTGFGISGIYDQTYNYFEFGFYSNFYYTFPIDSSPVSLGFGSRLDVSFSMPLDTFSMGVISGFAMNANLNSRTELYLIIGPQVTAIFPDNTTSMVGVGGGLDLGITYYFNNEKTVGGSFGVVNYFSACLRDDYTPAYFGYYGGAYIGLTVRFESPFYAPLPLGYSYIDYISI